MKAKITALVLTILVISSFFYVSAQTSDVIEVTNAAEVTETTEETPLESTRCEDTIAEINQRIINYKTIQPVHTATYQMLYLKVDTAVKQAKVYGYETDEVEADLVELDILISQFDKSFDTFIEKYEATLVYRCNENLDAQYAQSYIDAKKALGDVKDITQEIYDLYEDEIRENLLSLEKVE